MADRGVHFRSARSQAAEHGVSPTHIKCFALDPVSDGTSNVSGALVKHVTAYKVQPKIVAHAMAPCVLGNRDGFRRTDPRLLRSRAWSVYLLRTAL